MPPSPDEQRKAIANAVQSRDRLFRRWGAAFAGAAVTSVFGALLFDSFRHSETLPMLSEKVVILNKEVGQLADDISKLSATQSTFRKTLDELQHNTNAYASLTPADRQSLNEVIVGTKSLDSRLSLLEEALRLDATKALAVPMLRKDMDALQVKTTSDLSIIQSEMGRLFGLAQWLIGLMFTIAFGVFSMTIVHIFRGEKKPPEPKEGTAKAAG
jgi:hypothetical protein